MAELSPAAQAILDAFFFNRADEPLGQDRQCLVAALRVAAEELYDSPSVDYLWAIADELDNTFQLSK